MSSNTEIPTAETMPSNSENPAATTSSTSQCKKFLTLRTFDDQTFEVEEVVALESLTIKHMVEDGCADNVIPVPNLSGSILAKVIEYCRKHVEERTAETGSAGNDSLKAWDAEFANVDQKVLFEIILAANYLDIEELMDLTCQTVADMIKGKTPEEVREFFNITNDFTPEEEKEVRRQNQWAFE